MEAPRPRAGPFTATTMGFLKWMNANTKSLNRESNCFIKNRKEDVGDSGQIVVLNRSLFLPHSICNSSALLPPVCGQTADEVGGLQTAAEDGSHGAQQQQFTVISSCVAQGPTNFLHDLKSKEGHSLLNQKHIQSLSLLNLKTWEISEPLLH